MVQASNLLNQNPVRKESADVITLTPRYIVADDVDIAIATIMEHGAEELAIHALVRSLQNRVQASVSQAAENAAALRAIRKLNRYRGTRETIDALCCRGDDE